MSESKSADISVGSRQKSTLWNFFFLNIGFIITIFNGILMIPLYLHYMSGPVYGAWLATGNILTWITIIDPGVAGVILQRVSFSIGKNDREDIGLAITSAILISTVLFFIAMLFGYALSFYIGGIAKIDVRYRGDIIGAFRIAMWGTAFSLLADTFRNIILAYQKTKFHGILLYSVLVASIVLNVVLLVMHMGVYALAYTSLFRGVLIFGFALFYSLMLLKKNQIKFNFKYLYFKSFSKIFAFTFSSSLFETIASNVDLILVSRYLGSQAVTVLDLCRRPIRMVSGVANNVTISMLPSLPHLFGSGDNEKIKATITRIWNVIIWITGFIIGGFILFNYSFISDWVGNKFWIGNTNNIILCISILLWSLGYNLSNITLSMGDIKNNSLLTIIRSILYIIALFSLAKLFGMTGVLIAFLIPGITMVSYYPKKLYQSVLTKDLGLLILREALLTCFILIVCAIISRLFIINLKWFWLIIYSGIYSITFLFTAAIFSRSFKNEIMNVVSMVKLKRVKSIV
jgi:O-antigen/teichoic acid export membrane protein